MSTKKFSDLRKQSANFESLQQKVRETKEGKDGKKSYKDDRFWRATQDKAGNAQAVIRFLPAPKGEDLPYVKLYTFGFQGPTGQWFIENCPSTIGKPCPVLDANNVLWKSGIDENKEIARKRKRKTKYISNIYVVSDPANPENEGKVFLFEYGTKIFEKISDVMTPQFEDETPMNPFDLWDGANFKLKIVKKDGYANYDKSSWDKCGPLAKSDEDLEAIWNAQHSLNEFIAEEKFKSFDELKKRFETVISGEVGVGAKSIDEALKNAESIANSIGAEDDDGLEAVLNSEDSEDDLDAFKALVE